MIETDPAAVENIAKRLTVSQRCAIKSGLRAAHQSTIWWLRRRGMVGGKRRDEHLTAFGLEIQKHIIAKDEGTTPAPDIELIAADLPMSMVIYMIAISGRWGSPTPTRADLDSRTLAGLDRRGLVTPEFDVKLTAFGLAVLEVV